MGLLEPHVGHGGGDDAGEVNATQFAIVKPSLAYLPAYKQALERGWSPDNLMTERKRLEQLSAIAKDAAAFVESLDDPEAKGAPITMPNGSTQPRLPGYARWMWDGEFCGHIGFRWDNGTPALPPTCLGHIGYSVVPWKQHRGYATEALRLLLPEAKAKLPYVVITANADNVASQRVILKNEGYLIEQFVTHKALGEENCLRYRIDLASI